MSNDRRDIKGAAARKRPKHLWKKGQSGNPAGPPKGYRKRATKKLAKEMAAKHGIMPVDFLLGEMRAAKNNKVLRVRCAESAAPYLHRRMPIGIDGGEGKPLTLVNAEALAKLSDKELETLTVILRKVGINVDEVGPED